MTSLSGALSLYKTLVSQVMQVVSRRTISSVQNDYLFMSVARQRWDLTFYLIRVVFQRAVVTVVTHAVPVSIPLIHVIDIWAIVVLIQNTFWVKVHLLFFWTFHLAYTVSCDLKNSLTVPINVDSAGITFSVIVGVRLVSVSLVNTVVTAIADIISVCVILGRVVQPRAVVLDNYQHKIKH